MKFFLINPLVATIAVTLFTLAGSEAQNSWGLPIPQLSTESRKASVYLSWNSVHPNAAYILYRKGVNDPQHVVYTANPGQPTFFTDTGITNGNPHEYKLLAYIPYQAPSSDTAWIPGSTFLDSVPNCWVTKDASNYFTVEWTPVPWADSYDIYLGSTTPNGFYGTAYGTSYGLGFFLPANQDRVVRVFPRNTAGYGAPGNWAYFNGIGTLPPIDLPPSPTREVRPSHPFMEGGLKPGLGGLPQRQPIDPYSPNGNHGPLASGDPVDTSTGNSFYSPHPDLITYNPNGVPASFQRAYSSAQAQHTESPSPGLSPGWSHNYDLTILTDQTATLWKPVALRFPQAARIEFTPKLQFNQPTGEFDLSPSAPYLVTGTPGSTVNTWQQIVVTSADRTRWIFTPHPTKRMVMTQVLNSQNQGLTLTYNTARQLVSVHDYSSSTNLLSLSYNANNQLHSVADRDGRKIYYSFKSGFAGLAGAHHSGRSQIITATPTQNQAPELYKYGYQAGYGDGPLLSQIRAVRPNLPESVGTITWATNPQTSRPGVAKTTDGNGNITQFTYQAGQTLIQIKSPAFALVHAYTQKYDSLKRYTGTVDAAGFQTAFAFLDSTNPYLPTQFTDQVGRSKTFSYDQFGNQLSESNFAGQTTTSTYDYSPFPLGRPLVKSIDGQIVAQVTYFEPSGNIASLTAPSPTGSGTVTTSFTYDSIGNLLAKTNPGLTQGQTITESYNYTTDGNYSQPSRSGQPLTHSNGAGEMHHFRYNTAGQLSASWDPLGNTTTYTYNLAGQTTQIFHPIASPGAAIHATFTDYLFPGGPVSSAGTAFGSIPIPSQSVSYIYGGEGELLGSVGSQESRVTTFDAAYRPIQSLDTAGRATFISYDTRGYITSATQPSGEVHSYSGYSPVGLPASATFGLGSAASISYDPISDNITSVSFPSDPSLNQVFSYHQSGDLISQSNQSSQTAFTYNSLGQVLSKVTTFPGLPPCQLQYEYSPSGILNLIQTPAGAFSFGYDNAARITSLTNPIGEVTHFSYLQNGWLHQKTNHNGGKAINTFDGLGRITGVQNLSPTNVLQSEYTISTFNSQSNPLQLISHIPFQQAHSGVVNLQYSTAGGLSQESTTILGGYQHNFAFNSLGNPTQFQNLPKTYNANGQRQAAGFAFNSSGAPTLFAGISLLPNQLNQLAGIATVTNKFDPDGLRATKQSGSSPARHFIYHGRLPILEFDQLGQVTAVNTFGPSGLISRNENGASTFYNFDLRGGTAQRQSQSGNLLSQHTYTAFGTPASTTTTDDPWINFQAQHGVYRDHETNLLLATLRYYDPAEGTWLTPDPVGITGGNNLYQYVAGNPIANIDPWGTQRDALYHTSDYFAGFGDAGSFGFTKILRASDRSESVVDRGSLAYKAGQGTDLIIGLVSGRAATKGLLSSLKGLGKVSAPKVSKAAIDFSWPEFLKTWGPGVKASYNRGMLAENEIRTISGGVKHAFDTPHGIRLIDNLWGGGRIAEEVKTGIVRPSSFIRNQVAKDAHLLKSGAVDEVNWVFTKSSYTGLKGPSNELAKILKEAGINIIYK